jgi:archaellum biogenesis ATPase FlaH
MNKNRLGVIETLLDDGVVIFEEDLDKVENILKSDPDLITDVIKVHKFAKDNDVVIVEYIYPTRDYKLVYEIGTYSARNVVFLSMDLDMLGLRSENLIVSIAYPKEEVEYEGD